MPGHSGSLVQAFVGFAAAAPALFAYIGAGPGPDLVPYVFGLLGVVGTAIMAVVQRPVVAALSWLRARRGRRVGRDAPHPAAGAPAESGKRTPTMDASRPHAGVREE